METTTETNTHNRELTSTEIKITLAQIQDRLERAIKAARESNAYYDSLEYDDKPISQEEDNEEDKAKEKKRVGIIREKYNIPKGVHLMDECAVNEMDIKPFMKFAKWWVKGEMSEEIFNLFTYHYCEIVEVDFFWVLMDEPGNYYRLGIDEISEGMAECGYVILESELKKIGTRSKKKAKMNFKLVIGHGMAKMNDEDDNYVSEN